MPLNVIGCSPGGPDRAAPRAAGAAGAPPMRKPADLAAAMEAIAAAAARGLLAPAEAAELAKVVDTFANAIEMRDFVSRCGRLEDRS